MAGRNQLTTSDYLSFSEYERLIDSLHKDENYFWEAYARISFCTACRASDVLNLRWCDILDKSETTVVEKKTGKPRTILFNKSVRKKIKELHALLGNPDTDNYVFQNNKTGRPITIQRVNQTLKELKRHYRLIIGNFSTHTFRKTFGRYVYEKNHRSAESLILLNMIFRHAEIDTTKTYIGITQDEINSVYNSISF